jgi:hypothetical protein
MNTNMKKIVFLFLVMALMACQESLDERCARECRDYTKKNCPSLIADGVTIDSLVFQQNTRTLTYYYTVEGVIDDAEQLKKHDLRGELLKELKNSTSMKTYKDAGYHFRYVYYSTKNSGTKVFDTTFRQKDYQ